MENIGNRDIFLLKDHINNSFDIESLEDHNTILIKMISKIFLELRFHSFTKELNLSFRQFGMRQSSNKLVLFNNQ